VTAHSATPFRACSVSEFPFADLKVLLFTGIELKLYQLRIEPYLNACEGLGNRASLLGRLRVLFKLLYREAGYGRFGFQFNQRDAETLGLFFQMYFRCCVNALRREARLRELSGHGHGETTGVRGAEQFFGIRACAVGRAATKIVWALKGAAAYFDAALSVEEFSFPFCFCCS
jgi:hypothetical protein